MTLQPLLHQPQLTIFALELPEKTVAAFFTPTSKKKPEPITWRVIDNSLVVGKYAHPEERRRPPSSGKQKVAAFDLVSECHGLTYSTCRVWELAANVRTCFFFFRCAGLDVDNDCLWTHVCDESNGLEVVGSGCAAQTASAAFRGVCIYVYSWANPLCEQWLISIANITSLDRYQVVVMSNQGAIKIQKQIKSGKSGKSGKSDSKSLGNFKEKVSIVLCQLALPMSVYAAVENDENRKPRPGMWREFLDDYDLDVQGVDLANSIFVGDAAGRPGDHSCVDR